MIGFKVQVRENGTKIIITREGQHLTFINYAIDHQQGNKITMTYGHEFNE